MVTLLAKQILIVSILLPVVAYYSFAAFRRATAKVRYNFGSRMLFTAYVILSLAIVSALILLPIMATTSWPSLFFKNTVSILIALFFGQVVLTLVMIAGDLLKPPVLLFRALSLHLQKRKKPPVHRGRMISRNEFVSRLAILCGSVFSLGLLYGMTNKYRYEIQRIKISLSSKQQSFKGLRIAQISDIHCGSLDNIPAVASGIQSLMQLNADLILFTGDLVNYRSKEAIPFMETFKKLHAPLGVYSVLGNHDYGDYIAWPTGEEKQADFAKLLEYQKSLGWKVLRNEHVMLSWKDNFFALIGSENWSVRERYPKYGDLDKAIAGIESKGAALQILMSHDPTHWDGQVRTHYPNIGLTLSGHTHGMQFGVDNQYLHWSPAQYMYKRWAGLYCEKGQLLYVNRGFGCIGYEGRLGVMPEITLFEFV